jgi:polygalacturonase
MMSGNRAPLLRFVISVAMLIALGAAPVSAAAVKAPQIPERTVSLADFGTGDGQTLNTAAFEKAINKLSREGGGKLVVPPGIWLTGPIELRSRINLYLEAGALVQFSGDYRLYPLIVVDLRGEKDVNATSPISGENLEDVAITGDGILDGGGDAWRCVKKSKLTERDWGKLVKSGGVLNVKGDEWWPSRAALEGKAALAAIPEDRRLKVEEYAPYHQYLRPRMVRLIDCKRVLIEGVTVRNPPNWTLNPVLCEDVSVLNVKVFNSHTAQNSDALDLESCRHVLVRGCIFDVGDDGITLKSGKDAKGRRIGVPTEDVTVEDCTVYRAHGGFTIGSEMSGGVCNVRVNNCTFIGTDIGLRFKSTRGRGGVVENIRISNVRMADIVTDAINFNLYYGFKAPTDEDGDIAETAAPAVSEGTPQFRAIRIENVVCRGAQNAVVMRGLPEMPLRDITMRNSSFSSQQGVSLTDCERIVFEQVLVTVDAGESLKTLRVRNSKLDLAE